VVDEGGENENIKGNPSEKDTTYGPGDQCFKKASEDKKKKKKNEGVRIRGQAEEEPKTRNERRGRTVWSIAKPGEVKKGVQLEGA